MMDSRYCAVLLCLSAAVLLSACGSSFSPTFTPEVGDKRTIQQTDFITMAMEVMGQSMPMNMSNDAAWTCEVTAVDAAGDVTMLVTIERMRVDLGMDMLEGMPGMDMDFSFLNDAQEAMKGQSFTVTVSPGGEIRRIEGADAIAQHVQSQITLPRGMPGMGGAEMLSEFVGEAALRQQVEMWMAPYKQFDGRPARTWTKQGSQNMGMSEMGYTQTFTLNEVDQGAAKLSFESVYDVGGDGMMGMDMTPEGKATGTAELELGTGWIRRMQTNYNLTVSASMEGMPGMDLSMSMTLTGNSRLETR